MRPRYLVGLSLVLAALVVGPAFARETRTVSAKIVNGEPAPVAGVPWTVAFAEPQPGGGYFAYCGGTLLSSRWVLTAAHCDVRPSDVVITNRRDLGSATGDVLTIARVVRHPHYNPKTQNNDATLVKLKTPTAVTRFPTVLGAGPPPGTPVTILGWGRLSEGGPTSAVLQVAEGLEVLDDTECRTAYLLSGTWITKKQFCAARRGCGMGACVDTCQGDSGGPLVVGYPDTPALAGITSFGIGCARPEYPGVYTRVASVKNWIGRVTGMRPTSVPTWAWSLYYFLGFSEDTDTN